MKEVVIGALLILTGLVATQGLGTEFGVLQEVQEFEDLYPSDNTCNWNETGVETNLIYTNSCELNIEDLSSDAIGGVDLDRFYASDEDEWIDGASQTRRILYNTSEDYGDYIARSEASNSQTTYYYTNNFYTNAETIYLDYKYQELTSGTVTVELYDGQVRDSITLEPGSGNQDFQNSASLNPSNAGDHQLRVTFDDATPDEQRIYELKAYQNSSDTTGVASGIYESNVRRQSSEIYIDRTEYQGDDITGIGSSSQQTAELIVYGYDSGEVQNEKHFNVGNEIRVEEESLFPDQQVDSYRFDILLISETSETPEHSYVEFRGGTYDRFVTSIPTLWLQAFVFVIFLGMGILYMAKI